MADCAETLEQAQHLRHLASTRLPKLLSELESCCGRAFPSAEDLHFYSNFPQFRGPLQAVGSRSQSMLRAIASCSAIAPAPGWPQEEAGAGEAEESGHHGWLLALQDEIFERVDSALDDFRNGRPEGGLPCADADGFRSVGSRRKGRSGKGMGRDDRAAAARTAGAGRVRAEMAQGSHCRPVAFHAPSVPRPQDRFDAAVDNSNAPFKHPHRRNPRDGSAPTAPPVSDSLPPTHPLEEEIRRMDFLDSTLIFLGEPKKPMKISDTPITMVNTLGALKDLASKLQCESEIAVDLENHQYRSFQGFTCLMQISTRVDDFIVDALELRSHIGTCLGEIFSTPKIRKVMHGADSDILWLQRDFGIYVCNLFDTHQASRVLQMETHSLSYLLEKFCDVKTDKRYQLADWRIRPLSAEMLKYAREDTHYLLYLYDLLKQMLIAAQKDTENPHDLLIEVYSHSSDVCLKLYEKELLTETSHLHVYGLRDKKFTYEQISVLAGVYAWRDKIARTEDESTGYVLPNHLLLKLAEEMPDTVTKLLSMLNTRHRLVAQNAATLVEIIKQSRQQGKDSCSSVSSMRKQYNILSSGERKRCITEHIHRSTGSYMEKGSLENTVLYGEKDNPHKSAFDMFDELTLKNLGISTGLPFSVVSEKCQMNKSENFSCENVNQGYNHIVSMGNLRASLSLDKSDMPGTSLDTKDINSPVLKRTATSSLFGYRSKKIPSNCELPNSEKKRILRDHTLFKHIGIIGKDMDKNYQVHADNNCSQHLSVNTEKEFEEIEFSDISKSIAVNTPHCDAPKDVVENCLPASQYSPIACNATISDHMFVSKAVSSVPLPQATRKSLFTLVSKKAPCGLASLLAPKSRISVEGTATLIADSEQPEARVKVDLIKASVVLPFHTFSEAACRPSLEKTENAPDIKGIPGSEGKHRGEFKELHTEADTSFLSTKSIENSPSHCENIILLEAEEPKCDMNMEVEASSGFEVSRTGGIIVSPSGHCHRGWWPSLVGNAGTGCQESAEMSELDFPRSISELYKRTHLQRTHPNNAKKLQDYRKKEKAGHSIVGEPWPALPSNHSNTAGQEPELHALEPFDYEAAKRSMESDSSFSNLFDKRVSVEGNMANRSSQAMELAFDPLRRFREELRSQERHRGRRRKVFPQSGNRTGIFK